MIHSIDTTDLTPTQTRELRRWLGAHGVVSANVTYPCWIDPAASALIIDQLVAAEGQEDADFPECRLDDDGQVITHRTVVSLTADPPAWAVPSSRSENAA